MAESALRFLVIRLSSIGDIVHALPAVAALGEAFPSAKIHWAVENRLAVLLEGNPFIHRVVKLDTLGWRHRLGHADTLEEIVRGVQALREVPFEAAIDFQGLFKSAFIARVSRSLERVGFAESWLREPGAGVFYTQQIRPQGRRHVIEMNMALVEHFGARPGRWQFPLPCTAEDECYAEERLASIGARDFVLITPGGGWMSKCWAPDNYAELIRRLEAELSWKVVLTGSAQEEELIRMVLERAGSRQASYIPSTLVQMIALARRARLFVGVDTGPMHLAAAVGTPVVALFGALVPQNTPERNGPFSAADIVLTGNGATDHSWRSKNARYLQGIAVEAVLAAVRKRLARSNG
jgi:lipopolysaccharide heptosyltransferase I